MYRHHPRSDRPALPSVAASVTMYLFGVPLLSSEEGNRSAMQVFEDASFKGKAFIDDA